jgi:branched-chain amino acid aminotransferase
MLNNESKKLRVAPKVWKNGNLINWDEAHIHVMSHVVNYGSSVFEGIRAYKTENGPAIFRLQDHMQRLINSAKIYRMITNLSVEDFCRGAVDVVRQSGFDSCYLRPVIIRGLDQDNPAFGINPFPNPIDCYIAAWDWGTYLGEEALENGIDVCVSSWTRITSNSMPAMAKSGANYMNSQLIKMEAVLNGFSEGIALDDRGFVSEGSGENLFLVQNGNLITPPLGASILPGITRDSVIQIAREMGIPVVETIIQRAALYLADEMFFTGTAAEITPIRSIDRVIIGDGKRGKMTKKIQHIFFELVRGKLFSEKPSNWLTFVDENPVSMTVNR